MVHLYLENLEMSVKPVAFIYMSDMDYQASPYL